MAGDLGTHSGQLSQCCRYIQTWNLYIDRNFRVRDLVQSVYFALLSSVF